MSDDNARDTTWVRWVVGFVVVPIVVAAISAGALSLSRATPRSADVPIPDDAVPATSVATGTSRPSNTTVAPPSTTKSPDTSKQTPVDDSPMGRCRRGATPDQQGTSIFAGADSDAVYPPRTAAAPDPPNVIQSGDVVKVIATGSMYFTAIGQWSDPSGIGTPAPDGWLAPHVSEYSAIVRYNTNPGGWVGDPFAVGALSACTRYSAGYPVRLVFMTNTIGEQVGDSGAWSFRVEIYRS
jgi:hypothetical protein